MKTAKQLVKDSKHFCILPWIHFHAWPDKKVMPCCIADSDMPVSEVRSDQSILEMMNSQEYKEMRLKMLADEPVEACNRCYELENDGTWTLRQSQNAVRGMESEDLIECTNLDGSIDEFQMKYMDIRFSNLCNYKCRSCGPECSNLHGEEEIKLVGLDEFERRFNRTETLVNCNDDGVLMDQLQDYLGDVQECYFAGGEILVTREHYQCLKYWIDNDMAKDVKLNYTTNMSVVTYKDKNNKDQSLFDLWKHFPNIEMWASIDAIEEQGEIIRKGFRWAKVKQNLLDIREHASHIKLGITPTISIWNVFVYSKMFDWMYDNGFISTHNPPRVNVLTYPDNASIKILPENMRVRLIREFKHYIAKFSENDDDVHIKNGWKVLIQTLWEGRDDRTRLLDFFEITDEKDRVRDEVLVDVIPELLEVREWANRKE